MKILHTADWHLGAELARKTRFDEFDSALDFLLETLHRYHVESLVIAGDVFDTPVPRNKALEQYCNFLMKAADSGVCNIVVTAGNHDSPGFLEAPATLLARMNIHVIGRISPESPDRQIIPLKNSSGNTEAVILAVPFLRERDLLDSVVNETFSARLHARRKAVHDHYRVLAERANVLYPGLPLIAAGHFWAVPQKLADTPPGSSSEIGGEDSIPIGDLPGNFSYLALGHIHTPLAVAGSHSRYSGSLLPMTFREAETRKEFIIFDTGDPENIQSVAIPEFRKLMRISGDISSLSDTLLRLKSENTEIWIEAVNTGPFMHGLNETLAGICANSKLELLICRNESPDPVLLRKRSGGEKLSELAPDAVFMRLLDAQKIPDDEQSILMAGFREIRLSLQEAEE